MSHTVHIHENDSKNKLVFKPFYTFSSLIFWVYLIQSRSVRCSGPCFHAKGMHIYCGFRPVGYSHRITESQDGRGWKGPLWVTQSNPPAEAGSPIVGCRGPCPGRSGVSPEKEINPLTLHVPISTSRLLHCPDLSVLPSLTLNKSHSRLPRRLALTNSTTELLRTQSIAVLQKFKLRCNLHG